MSTEGRQPPLAHWDEVESFERAVGHIAGRWQRLGEAAGSVGVGLTRIRVEPGCWSTPAHVHGREEEIFVVLAGAGLSWQGGRTYAIRARDVLLHRAGGEPHTLRAGEEVLDVLAFGERADDEACHLPRAGVSWLGPSWVGTGGEHPYAREAAAGPPELPPASERPRTIVCLDDVARERWTPGATVSSTCRDLGMAVGSRTTGIQLYGVEPGKLNAPPHCHSAEEELFVVLDGDGSLLLGDEQHALRRGHVVARPPGTRVAHAFRAGASGLALLAYGTRRPNDICFYPRSGKVSFRGVGVIGRIEPLDYWQGEE